MNGNDPLILPRRATLRLKNQDTETRMLSDWRHLDAYVLLGEPGLGKSVAFEQEHTSDPTGTVLISVRDFVTIGPPAGSENKILLIDALDEQRASSNDHNGPLDKLRIRLNELGRPRFRLSCREADWIASDVSHLRAVAPGESVHELRLEPLNDAEVLELLKRGHQTRIDNPEEFLEKAHQRRLKSLLGNPLLLELLVEAVQGDNWPANRHETYLLACQRLTIEHNEAHRIAQRLSGTSIETTLHDAGLLCALLLLSDSHSYVIGGGAAANGEILLDTIPSALGIQQDKALKALSSKLFATEGQHRSPRHRTIAEFLAARAIAHLISNGLPVTRILALMGGFDGRIVEPLRGLYAWLATCCPTERGLLIDRDPLGLVLYGDVHPFSVSEKRRVLDALYNEGQRYRWFRNENWESHPFGALGTADMEGCLQDYLSKGTRDPAHEVLLDCIADAIKHGDDMPRLASSLECIVRDTSHWGAVRKSALDALIKLSTFSATAGGRLLDDIVTGKLDDPDDELLGILLVELYPKHLPVEHVFRYLHPRKDESLIGNYHMFWASGILGATPPAELPHLLDELATVLEQDHDELHKYAIDTLANRLLPRILAAYGATEPVERVHRWLQAATGKFGSPELHGDDATAIRTWYAANPKRQKELFAYAMRLAAKRPTTNLREFWPCEQLLYNADRPRDWYSWLLTVPDSATPESMARYCLENAAYAAANLTDRFDVSADEVANWVTRHSETWQNANNWLENTWKCLLDEWPHTEFLWKREDAFEREADRLKRKANMAPLLPFLFAGTAPPALMQDIAFAYVGMLSDIQGETPTERVQDLLVVEKVQAERAISAIKLCLQRADLPSSDQILDLSRNQRKRFLLQQACLLAATLLEEEAPGSCANWSDTLAATMTAFVLVSNDSIPEWFKILAEAKPHQAATVLLLYTQAHIQENQSHVPMLYLLRSEEQPMELGRLILPTLLQDFPEQASDDQHRMLQNTLLPAAFVHLDAAKLQEIITARLRLKKMDAGQRIVWLVANMEFNADQSLARLVKFVATDIQRAMVLGDAFESLRQKGLTGCAWSPSTVSKLVESLAVHVGPERQTGVSDYTNRDRLRDVVRALTDRLASSPDRAAGQELLRLRQLDKIAPWWVTLEACHSQHIKVARVEAFRFANVGSVAQALANRSPANAQDLVALVMAQLASLAEHIRFDDTNKIRLFWRDTTKKGAMPKVENDCRDVLYGFLRDRMQFFGVQVEKEIHAANEKRCDIHASVTIDGRRVAIPIEIKKEDHPEVWTAWQDQLLAQYSTNPAANGLGIYLILWFGVSPKAFPRGKKPKSAQQMADHFCQVIPMEFHSRIFGLVLDLSSLKVMCPHS